MLDCFRCGNTYSSKSNLNKHLRKQQICDATYLNVSRDALLERYDIYRDLYNQVKYHQYPKVPLDEVPLNGTSQDNKWKKYECEFCGNRFTAKNHYYRHRKHNCKKNIGLFGFKDLKTYITQEIQRLESKYEQEQMVKEQTMKIQSLENKIDKLVNTLSNIIPTTNNNISSTNSHNTTTNSHNNTTTNSHNNIQININNYGEEDLSKLTMNDWKDMMYGGISHLFEKFIEKVYVDVPENRNIYIKNVKDGCALIFDNNSWKQKNRKELIDDFYRTKLLFMQSFADSLSENDTNMSCKIKSKVNHLFDDIEEILLQKKSILNSFLNINDCINQHYKNQSGKDIKLGSCEIILP